MDLPQEQNQIQMKIGLIGIAYDEKSSFMRGPAEAPAAIRRAYASESSNQCAEDGLSIPTVLADGGDLTDFAPDPVQRIDDFVSQKSSEFPHLVILGGDHSISFPVVRAVARKHGRLNIVHFDAHPDLYEEFEGDRFSHACPFARIMEAGLAQRLIQIGVRTANAHQRAQAARYGVETIEARNWTGRLPQLNGPVYISVDIDVLDPAFAPGVSHHEPGGLSMRELINAIQSITAPIVAADVIELNPRRDRDDVTAVGSAKIMRELAAAIVRSNPLV
jgi:arginase